MSIFADLHRNRCQEMPNLHSHPLLSIQRQQSLNHIKSILIITHAQYPAWNPQLFPVLELSSTKTRTAKENIHYPPISLHAYNPLRSHLIFCGWTWPLVGSAIVIDLLQSTLALVFSRYILQMTLVPLHLIDNLILSFPKHIVLSSPSIYSAVSRSTSLATNTSYYYYYSPSSTTTAINHSFVSFHSDLWLQHLLISSHEP